MKANVKTMAQYNFTTLILHKKTAINFSQEHFTDNIP
ncbi:MAG: hypothetical protein RLZZ419_597 [Pseudomonadota bacterium]|jgi:hypothetical protein